MIDDDHFTADRLYGPTARTHARYMWTVLCVSIHHTVYGIYIRDSHIHACHSWCSTIMQDIPHTMNFTCHCSRVRLHGAAYYTLGSDIQYICAAHDNAAGICRWEDLLRLFCYIYWLTQPHCQCGYVDACNMCSIWTQKLDHQWWWMNESSRYCHVTHLSA